MAAEKKGHIVMEPKLHHLWCSRNLGLCFYLGGSNLPHRKTDSDEFHVPGFPQNYKFHRTQLHKFLRAADGTDEWSQFFIPQTALSMKSDGWICNTVEEIEPLGLHLLRNYLQLPVWPVGPLLPPASLSGSKHRAGKEPGIALEACMEWLDLKDENYVLYISFGSQNTIRASQMMALAEGLEESGRSFIWVIWPPFGFDINGEFIAEWLPKGCGVPMIGWPLAAEQAYNVKVLVEEMGVAVEPTRTVETVISGEQVKKVIEIVMEQEGKGKEMKEKANEIAAHLREAITEKGKEKGSLVRAMDDLVRTILSPKAK
ncbi:UDP-glycosyltransferase 92A1 [Glycine max]|nr:UDP-glycosyltransferase 92A1 [Glycine max]